MYVINVARNGTLTAPVVPRRFLAIETLPHQGLGGIDLAQHRLASGRFLLDVAPHAGEEAVDLVARAIACAATPPGARQRDHSAQADAQFR
ncbi:hypothetical protein [Acidiferrobacter sp.]|uniref:hypothetical protein n=1 Tax=Acidiferrobacter sp. TaxID=1872107 RepID=UPI002605319F|nr:hypothetical protein [Acidiferrobacter sp.]